MPRVCTICTHFDREAIDAAIADRRGSMRAIAREHDVSEDALRRHRDDHLGDVLASAKAAESVRADDVVSRVIRLANTAEAILVRAEEKDDDELRLKALREARPTVELLARLAGRLQSGFTTNVMVNAPGGAVQVVQSNTPQTRLELERDIRLAQARLAEMVAAEAPALPAAVETNGGADGAA